MVRCCKKKQVLRLCVLCGVCARRCAQRRGVYCGVYCGMYCDVCVTQPVWNAAYDAALRDATFTLRRASGASGRERRPNSGEQAHTYRHHTHTHTHQRGTCITPSWQYPAQEQCSPSSVCLSACIWSVCLLVSSSVSLSHSLLCLSVCLSVCLSACLSVCMAVCLSVCCTVSQSPSQPSLPLSLHRTNFSPHPVFRSLPLSSPSPSEHRAQPEKLYI